MNSALSQWLSMTNMILGGLGMAGVLIIVWIGWLRTRRFAYLVLGAWALTTMFGIAVSAFFFPAMRLGGNVDVSVVMWVQLIRSVVSSVLLVLGLGMLVLGERRVESPGQG